MSTVLILYGPKAVGKSRIAHVLAEHLCVYHLDPDELIPRLLAAGKQPDPRDGWLAEVAARVQDALANYDLVSVEATGAWESDWRLAHELEARGARVCRVWISAPKDVTLRRLQARTTPRVPVSVDEAIWIYDAATARAASTRLDLRVDTTFGINPKQVIEAVRPLIAEQHGAGFGALSHGGKVQLTKPDLPEVAMTDVDDFLAEIHPRLVAELQALHNGDPEPRLAMWSTQEPVTLFGAGMSGRGWEPVSRIFRSIASRWSDCTDQRVEILAAGVSGDLAYTVELEHTSVSIDGVPVEPYTLRVTQVYRREDGEWKVVHRHGDRLSINQSQGLPGEASTT